MTETSRFSEGDESIADFSVFNEASKKTPLTSMTSFANVFGAKISTPNPARRQLNFPENSATLIVGNPSNENQNSQSSFVGEVPKDEENANLDFPLEPLKLEGDKVEPSTEAVDKNKVTPVKNSGLFMYVDIHGHASKRGIFM